MAIRNPIMTDSKWCCVICLKPFSHRSGLRRHVRSVHGSEDRPYHCKECGKMFKRKDHLTCHVKNIHPQYYEEYIALRGAAVTGRDGEQLNCTLNEAGHVGLLEEGEHYYDHNDYSESFQDVHQKY